MKHFLVILIILFSAKVFSHSDANYSAGATSSFDSVEVFLSISHDDPATVAQVKSAIVSLSGTNYLSYCSNHAVFMVYIDQTIYATKKDFLDHLLKLVPQRASWLSIKQGAFKDLVGNCISTDAAESGAIKTKFGR